LGGYIVTAFSSSGSAMAIAPDWGRGFGLIEAYTTASGSSAIGGSPIKGCAALPEICVFGLYASVCRDPFPSSLSGLSVPCTFRLPHQQDQRLVSDHPMLLKTED